MVHVPNRRHLGRGIVQCRNRHPDSEELPTFAPEAMPIIRALTPHSAQTISLSGSILKPCDRLLIVVSKFPLSFSSHVAEPFSAHSGHVTDVTNRSRLATTASRSERRLSNSATVTCQTAQSYGSSVPSPS
jgi:hypothetical protein